MHGDPPTGRDKGIVAGKMCRKLWMACAWFLGCTWNAASQAISAVKWKPEKQVYTQTSPLCFHGNSQAKASLRLHLIFRVHEIRSTSDDSLAGSASMKRSPNIRIQWPRIAKITTKHSPAVQVIEQPHAWMPWMCVEQHIALFRLLG
jgi:hypothetical protein